MTRTMELVPSPDVRPLSESALHAGDRIPSPRRSMKPGGTCPGRKAGRCRHSSTALMPTLPNKIRTDNRAAARRMGEVLAKAGLALSDDPATAGNWLTRRSGTMAEAEHNGWMAQRAQTGWSWAATRDDDRQTSPIDAALFPTVGA